METINLKPRILYVDDEEENLMVFKSAFRRNYEISIAYSVSEAEQLLTDNSFDIIISDQRMPDITGVEFLKGLPDSQENIKMILTGFSDMEAIIEAMNSGKIYKYITKPWQRLDLQKVLDEAIKFGDSRKSEKQKIEKVDEEKKIIANLIEGKNDSTADASLQLELLKAKQALDEMSKQVAESNKNVHLLSEIGQEIISNLTIESIVESTYENVNTVMDANSFGIGIYNESEKRLEFSGWIEKGAALPFHYANLSEVQRPGVRCFLNREEVVINDFQVLKTPLAGDFTKSILYLPLITNDQPIGVISTQSFNKNAYTEYHLNFLRNIAVYVATAIENAKAYSLIEEQKTEIEQKNTELELKVQKRTEELRQMNDEVLKQKDQLEVTYRNVKLLSEIGQQITSTLSLDKIIETVYENVNQLMDAAVFFVSVYNNESSTLDISGAIEKGERLPSFSWTLNEDENRLAVWCFKNKKEVIINDFQTEYNKYIKTITKPVGQDTESIIYLPLISNDVAIGTISVQSFKKHSYNQYHIDILRSLATYATIAIENSNTYGRMTKAFKDLKTTQMKLVEAEKMASLGVLTAGVAHEINNPVNFVSAGIESLELNYSDVEKLLAMYLSYHPKTSSEADWEKIESYKKELSPDELLPEMDVLFKSIKSGAKRTSEIVMGLKNFTRLDENDMKKAKVEEGIENTLVILNNKLKNRVEVIKEFGDTPAILCYPGQLNQVFMNLLHNASDAIEGKGKILIKTWLDKNKLFLSFKDTGKGMPADVQSHIFEPFYTTKDVGKGTGLGLSIAYGIIEKHKGTIEVKSEVGRGTEFIITLPMTTN